MAWSIHPRTDPGRRWLVEIGRLTPRERRTALERLAEIPSSEERLVVATGRYVGEGFDDPRLDTLILALPVAWKGTVVQYAGRLHRQHAGKSEVRIHDYRDSSVPVLARMLEKRMRAYGAMGYAEEELVAREEPRLVVEYDADRRALHLPGRGAARRCDGPLSRQPI